jgi:hypothetical protein
MPFGKRQPTGFCGVDRRRVDRVPTDLAAQILLPDYQPLRCSVTDYSPFGARVELPSAFGLPDIFLVRVAGFNRRARIVRRGVRHVGVTFDE